MKRNWFLFLLLAVLLLTSCDLSGGLASLDPSSPDVAPAVTSSAEKVSDSLSSTEATVPTTAPSNDAPETTAAPTVTPSATTEEATTAPPAASSVTTVPSTTPAVTTAPPVSSATVTSPSDEPVVTAPSDGTLHLLSLTETVARGKEATVTVQGVPGRTYTITVYYPSSVSTAKGLEPKAADTDGVVSWSWRVGSRTSEGSHRIEISDGEELLTLYFTVTS